MSKMTGTMAERLALGFCMQGAGRYLECLNGVVNTYADDLPTEFVEEARRDFQSYVTKMTAAGLPVKVIESFDA